MLPSNISPLEIFRLSPDLFQVFAIELTSLFRLLFTFKNCVLSQHPNVSVIQWRKSSNAIIVDYWKVLHIPFQSFLYSFSFLEHSFQIFKNLDIKFSDLFLWTRRLKRSFGFRYFVRTSSICTISITTNKCLKPQSFLTYTTVAAQPDSNRLETTKPDLESLFWHQLMVPNVFMTQIDGSLMFLWRKHSFSVSWLALWQWESTRI